LAALGGCWWPIEVTPAWMQMLQKFMPTGWTMDALHKLISFQSGAASALPQVAIIVGATVVVTALAVRRFQYE
jgi:ABC-type multidrug transport system permease subunit